MSTKKIIQRYLPLFAAFIFGFFIASLTAFVLAHGGNANFIHACVKTANGDIRIVGPNDSCDSNETPLDWSQNGLDTFGGFTTNQLIGFDVQPFTYRNYSGGNFSDSTFDMYDIKKSNFSNTNFSNSLFRVAVIDSNFTKVNFTNANIRADFPNTNLTNANFTNANLTGTTNLDTSIRTGIIWSNTTCPDGTNSDNNGGTCEGHLTPAP